LYHIYHHANLQDYWPYGTWEPLRTTSSVTEGNNNYDNNNKPTKLSLCLGDLFTRINLLFAKGGTMTHLQTKFFIMTTMEWCIAQFPTIQRMSFIDLQCLFTPLVSSNFSYSTVRCVSILKWTNQLLIKMFFFKYFQNNGIVMKLCSVLLYAIIMSIFQKGIYHAFIILYENLRRLSLSEVDSSILICLHTSQLNKKSLKIPKE
jgi:hypothetical protein